MNTDNLNKWLTLAANLGVIAGILFLAIEIQQNNEALGLQARLDREDVIRAGLQKRMVNPDLLSATARALANEDLNNQDILILNELNTTTLTDFYMVFQQVQDGFLEESTISKNRWRDVYFSYPLMSDTYNQQQRFFSPEFNKWFGENVIEVGPL